MKKNKKQFQARNMNAGRTVEAPVQLNMDMLSMLLDDEIRDRNIFLRSTMDHAVKSGTDSYLWEVELAYLQREMQIRDARREAHEQYLHQNPEMYLNESVMDESYVDAEVN